MRWLVGWSSATAGPLPGARSRALQPVGAQLLWGDPDPLWAVGDWRPDEVRVVHADAGTNLNGRAPARGSGAHGAGADPYGDGYGGATRRGTNGAPYGSSQGVARLAVLGRCGATDAELRLGLVAARGGALRHVTAWPGSYAAVLQLGRRITVLGDLAGALPVFHTRWQHGTAYATAALPLADLIEAGLDVTHLAATLACPDAPEALIDGTPYLGVRRVPPGHALILRDGAPEITGYEPTASLAAGHQPASAAEGLAAVEGVRDALLDAVRVRLAQPRFVPDGALDGIGPAPGIGADLSGGIASSTLALLAAGLPGMPGTLPGAPGSLAGERLLAVTFNDLAGGGADGPHGAAAELERAREMAADPRLRHIVVPGGPEALPYADLLSGWSDGSGGIGALTDEPGPALVSAERHRRRLAAGGADHLIGHGARQVLDAHPARLADLLMDRRRRHLLRPVAALTRADGGGTLSGSLTSVTVPVTVYRAARRLARTPYRQGVEDVAAALLRRDFGLGGPEGPGGGALTASLAAMVWVRSGPAARWLTGEALAEVSVRLQEAARRPWPLERPGERRARAALARHAADYRVLEQAATVPSQRLHAPFLDNQVVRACQALPGALRVRPGARAEVLRVALSGAGVHGLPAGWGSSSPGAAWSSATRVGLRAALDPLLDLFEAPLLADAGLVDARVLRGGFRAAASAAAAAASADGRGAGIGEVLALEGLGEIVATEVWLRRLLGRRGSCWTGADAPEQRALAEGVQRLSL
ncbi:Asparagine synthase [Actinacidiphila yanglinensis]|uniref:Asparagine synthase n=1 Tax=Actinacidiphila yanglinensis TaxID=310779 RepID=A0A1H5YUH3_9ACTN|nr:asparagine synthase-related protein [Actinacidiphila yanglinensis]SEG27648.1 Asparagine synthase [Actinacidiphila yanglinensis]